MFYEVGDVVTITIDKPNGGTGGHKGIVGVIMEISDEAYRVVDVVGDSYWYYASELRPVGIRELESAFVSVIKHFVDKEIKEIDDYYKGVQEDY